MLIFRQDDGTASGIDDLVDDFTERGAKVMVVGKACKNAVSLAFVKDVSPVTAPILFIQSFYKMVNELAVIRGYNPDQPPHLNKVTETI